MLVDFARGPSEMPIIRDAEFFNYLTPHIIATSEDAHIFTEHKRQQSDKADEIKKQLQHNQPQENLELLLD